MGPSQAKHQQQIEACLNHPAFQAATFVQEGNARQILTSIGIHEKEYKSWKEKYESLKLNTHYLLLPSTCEFSVSGLCGAVGTLKLYFQDYPYQLADEIYNLRGSKKAFREQELWYLLYAISCACRDMRPEGTRVGDIRPLNIFINERAQIKVASVLSWPRAQTNYAKSLEGIITYLAPEDLADLKLGKIDNQNNIKSELFSIGLTLLSAICLRDFQALYDLKSFTLDHHTLQQGLAQFKLNPAYSSIFKATVCNLLQVDPHNRVDFSEMWEWLFPHEANILARQNFVFASAPSKIEAEYQALQQFLSGNPGCSTILAPLILASKTTHEQSGGLGYPSEDPPKQEEHSQEAQEESKATEEPHTREAGVNEK